MLRMHRGNTDRISFVTSIAASMRIDGESLIKYEWVIKRRNSDTWNRFGWNLPDHPPDRARGDGCGLYGLWHTPWSEGRHQSHLTRKHWRRIASSIRLLVPNRKWCKTINLICQPQFQAILNCVSPIFLPKITVSISCDILYQLLFLLYQSYGNTHALQSGPNCIFHAWRWNIGNPKSCLRCWCNPNCGRNQVG